MPNQRFHLRQYVLLVCFAALMVFLWMLPILLMGQVYDIYPLLLARNYALSGAFSLTDELGRFLAPHLLADAGVLATADGRLSAIFLAWVSPFISWGNFTGWGFVAAATVAFSLLAWWSAIAKLFDTRIAWVSTALIAFVPLYWRQAVWLDSYNFAILFLFLSFALFVHLKDRSHLLAVVVSGILFGLSVASKDTFLVFIPWYLIAYIWTYPDTKKKATKGIILFLLCTGVVYLTPYIGDIRELGYPVNHNVATLWPGAGKVSEGYYLHLYPDPYTYHFDREAYDAELLTKYESFSTLQQLQQQKIFINFDVGSPSIIKKLLNGLWLFVGIFPAFIHQNTVGGVVLWLFILPGIFFLWKKNRQFTVLLLGLAFSSELIMRFGLHYARDHLMDYGWMFMLFAAFGIAGIADLLSQKIKARTITLAIVTLLCVQLLQANRSIFADRYNRTVVPQTLALAGEISVLPETSVVALGVGGTRVEQLALLSNRTVVPFDADTIEKLLGQCTLSEAFDVYEVTHVYGYSDELLSKLKREVPSVRIISEPEVERSAISPFLTYLLHLVQ